MQTVNDNFKGCCGENSTLNIGEVIYCKECDQVAEIVAAEVEWMDGTATRFDYRGMLTQDVVSISQ